MRDYKGNKRFPYSLTIEMTLDYQGRKRQYATFPYSKTIEMTLDYPSKRKKCHIFLLNTNWNTVEKKRKNINFTSEQENLFEDFWFKFAEAYPEYCFKSVFPVFSRFSQIFSDFSPDFHHQNLKEKGV